MDRRKFVRDATFVCATGAAGLAEAQALFAVQKTALGAEEDINESRIPRWRGFNMQGRFTWPGHPHSGPAFDVFDFAAMKEWRFDFARLQLSYWSWGSREDWSQIREEPLKEIVARSSWAGSTESTLISIVIVFPAIVSTSANLSPLIFSRAELWSAIVP